MSIDLDEIQRLADLYNQLGQKLLVLKHSLSVFQDAHGGMTASLNDVNTVLQQLNLPAIEVPVQVDADWVAKISSAAASLHQRAESLHSATPPQEPGV